MLIGGSLAMLSLATAGGMVTNYGWREAQREEIDGALRAGVSAAAHFMRGDLTTVEEQIKERVAGFMRGLLGDITITKDDIAVDHDFSTNQTTISIEGNATFAFASLWGGGGAANLESLKGEYVIVAFDASQYEFALALDISNSMGRTPPGWTVTRLDALKDAIRAISQTVDDISRTNPGIVTLSLVPYANSVNVADTSGPSQTDAKERYVYMLTGEEYSTQTSRDTEAHWVDTFHNYGTGASMGPLASRNLPDFLVPADWNLHAPGTEDISAQAPHVGIWDFEGADFWNGCVMARWGAYWDPQARPVVWDTTDSNNWPARKTVAGWAPGSTGIQGLPLHLSDAPPDASDPNTRFTAYSWPDARIGGLADHMLSDAMWTSLQPGRTTLAYYGSPANHWHLRSQDRGGSLYCPSSAPIVPLTDDLSALQAADHYDSVPWASRTYWGQTFLHLGIVWGLRTLSPLWRDVWNTRSVSGDDLPRTPCLDGGTTQGCSQFVEKAIVIVSDGANYLGPPERGRSAGYYQPGSAVTANPNFNSGRCNGTFNYPLNVEFIDAWSAEDPATFANNFDVDAQGVLTPTGMSAVLDGFQAVHPTVSALDPNLPTDRLVIDAHRILWENALQNMTPWQLFRGYDANSPTNSIDANDVLVDPANMFDLQGRPIGNGHYCRPTTPFSAYGRSDELVRIGDGPPVSDVAPFSVPTWPWSDSTSEMEDPITDRLDDWFREACDIAGQRDVRVHAIYIGDDTYEYQKAAIALMEECVDLGYGGNPVKDEVHVAPTADELKDAIEEIMDIKRSLRFIGP